MNSWFSDRIHRPVTISLGGGGRKPVFSDFPARSGQVWKNLPARSGQVWKNLPAPSRKVRKNWFSAADCRYTGTGPRFLYVSLWFTAATVCKKRMIFLWRTSARSVFTAPSSDPSWLASGSALRQSFRLALGGSKHRPGFGLVTGIYQSSSRSLTAVRQALCMLNSSFKVCLGVTIFREKYYNGNKGKWYLQYYILEVQGRTGPSF